MPDAGDVDAIVYTYVGMFGDAPRHVGQGEYGIRLTPEFWRKLYAGLAIANVNPVVCKGPNDWADAAYALADAMIAHEAKSKEDDNEIDDKRG